MKALLAAVLLTAACTGRGRAPALLATMPEFSMSAVGPNGESAFGRSELLGKVWIADFVYTSCAGPCPLVTQKLSALGAQLPKEVGLLTVTVDPDGDTPERLRAYAREYDADPRRWVFLRGTPARTYELMFAGFHLPMSADPRAPKGARVLHSTRFVLIDRAGGIRGYYDGLSAVESAALVRDARLLLEDHSS